MGCDLGCVFLLLALVDFNPRTHMGCDAVMMDLGDISIKFQSTHPHGVRPAQYLLQSTQGPFQSTHPHGVRLLAPGIWSIIIHISIHAPTWGATTGKGNKASSWKDFNPRTHMGCDTRSTAELDSQAQFQSTHPHGVRPAYNPAYSNQSNFNPRTHMGCDDLAARLLGKVKKFQSTHPHGVRQGDMQ